VLEALASQRSGHWRVCLCTSSLFRNGALALAFGLLIVFLVIAGSMWIMTNLNPRARRCLRHQRFAG